MAVARNTNKGEMLDTSYRGEAAHSYDERRFTTEQGTLFSQIEFRELQRAVAQIHAQSRILEVGCGTARFSEYLGKQGFTVTATDPSPDMIAVASRKCRDLRTVQFKQEEGGRLSFADSTFDFAFAIRVTNQTESEEYALRMIREMIRVTRGDGLILVEFVNSQRPLAKRSRSVRLSFPLLAQVAKEQGCDVLSRHGVLVFSQTLLNRIPRALIPLWGLLEHASAVVFWRWASRGYVLLRKK